MVFGCYIIRFLKVNNNFIFIIITVVEKWLTNP